MFHVILCCSTVSNSCKKYNEWLCRTWLRNINMGILNCLIPFMNSKGQLLVAFGCSSLHCFTKRRRIISRHCFVNMLKTGPTSFKHRESLKTQEQYWRIHARVLCYFRAWVWSHERIQNEHTQHVNATTQKYILLIALCQLPLHAERSCTLFFNLDVPKLLTPSSSSPSFHAPKKQRLYVHIWDMQVAKIIY